MLCEQLAYSFLCIVDQSNVLYVMIQYVMQAWSSTIYGINDDFNVCDS